MTETASSVSAKGSRPRCSEDGSQALIRFFERSLTEWASDESATMAAGDWRDGGVMELVGAARVLPARYEGCFEGVRELRAVESEHHRPYDADRPRWSVIQPLVRLYEKYRQHEWVHADDGFTAALAGIPTGEG